MHKDMMFLDSSENLINSSEIQSKVNVSENISISDIELNNKEAKKIGKSKGKYITITFNKNKLSSELECLIDTICSSIKSILDYLKLSSKCSVLFVGLGNKSFACDKFGNSIIEKISLSNKSFKIYKDVLANTNIKSIDFIKSMSVLTDTDLVIVFDSLKANNISRLGSTIQLATSGLSPGSAYSDKMSVIDKSSIKKPVINIGVPTIINLKSIMSENPNLIVSTNDVDDLVSDLSSIISIAINRVF